MKLFRRFLFICSLFLFSNNLFSKNFDYKKEFSLNTINETILFSTSSLLAGSAFVFSNLIKTDLKKIKFDSSQFGINASRSSIPQFDQIFMRPYNKTLHLIGTATELLAMSTPVIFGFAPSSQYLTLGSIYLETMLFSYGIKEWIKLLVNRPRPYMYFENYPHEKISENDWNCSFPSGHSTLSFAAAAFTSYVFCQSFPTSKYRFLVTGVSFGLAISTAILRMCSGNHFFTDVLVGALIGTGTGLLIPYLHSSGFYQKFKKNKKIQTELSPLGFNVSFKF